MQIKYETFISVPHGFKCCGCNHLNQDSGMNTKPYFYCDMNGEIIKQNKKGECIKTEKCLNQIRKSLINGI